MQQNQGLHGEHVELLNGPIVHVYWLYCAVDYERACDDDVIVVPSLLFQRNNSEFSGRNKQ